MFKKIKKTPKVVDYGLDIEEQEDFEADISKNIVASSENLIVDQVCKCCFHSTSFSKIIEMMNNFFRKKDQSSRQKH